MLSNILHESLFAFPAFALIEYLEANSVIESIINPPERRGISIHRYWAAGPNTLSGLYFPEADSTMPCTEIDESCVVRSTEEQGRASAGPTTSSYMQRMAERPERGFLEGFALRRMRVDRSGDIFKPRAHLDGESERGRQFGNADAGRLNA